MQIKTSNKKQKTHKNPQDKTPTIRHQKKTHGTIDESIDNDC